MEISSFFKLMVERHASHLFFSVGAPPTLKIGDQLLPLTDNSLKSQHVSEIVAAIMNENQRQQFQQEQKFTMALPLPGLGRFRLDLFRQRGEAAIVVRAVKILPAKIWPLSPELKTLALRAKGLILVIGPEKMRLIAALINYRNEEQHGHILTIEDPIEYLFRHKKSIVDQREIGLDVRDYESALKDAKGAAADLIYIDNVCAAGSFQQILHYAETGTLCLTSVIARNAELALTQLVQLFPEEQRSYGWDSIAFNLQAIVVVHQQTADKQIHIDIISNNDATKKAIASGNLQCLDEFHQRHTFTEDAGDN